MAHRGDMWARARRRRPRLRSAGVPPAASFLRFAFRTLAVLVGAALVLGGGGACRDDGRGPDSTLSATALGGVAQGVALDGLNAELAGIRKALSSGRAPDFACAAAELLAAELRARPASPRTLSALGEVDRLCLREVPLTALTQALTRLEERLAGAGVDGAADPALDAADCAAAARSARPLALHHAGEPAVAASLARFDTLCPSNDAP